MAPPEHALFEYPKLAPGEDCLRLLKITIKDKDDPTDAVACELQSFFLRDVPSYKALSYTWRNPFRDNYDFESSAIPSNHGYEDPMKEDWVTECHKILCNGMAVFISLNLFELLRQIARNEESGFLWIDRLCINQQDITEKSSQVALMSTTYSSTESVIVWLERHDVHASAALQIQNDFKFALDLDYQTRCRHNPNEAIFWQTIAIQEPHDFMWNSWLKFFSRSWHSRLWTLQETSLAGSVEQVLCGELRFEWRCLRDLSLYYFALPEWMRYFRTRSQYFQGPVIAMKPRAIYEYRVSFSSEWEAKLGLRYGSSDFGSIMMEELLHSLPLQCSNPRDRIFAIFGMRQAGRRPEELSKIVIDNGDEPLELFRNVTEICLILSPSLAILSLVGHDTCHLSSGIPSWVPDFADRLSFSGLGHWRTAEGESFFNATQETVVPCPYRRVNPRGLSLNGARVGTVAEVTATCQLQFFEQFGNLEFLQDMLKLHSNLPKTLRAGMSRTEALWRTTFADCTDLHRAPAPSELEVCFHSVILHSIWVARQLTESLSDELLSLCQSLELMFNEGQETHSFPSFAKGSFWHTQLETGNSPTEGGD
ncbi:hypothetical protein GLAREA_01290 [Glarea lozoyensis ATCC 20868]|uniref:Heterokaryon incompatibility domain-containing protein n=1 Tax=Glarea lozoyensis (strain ATCC 20868 / MF5171) TaxID=1116229 RepID=S3DFG5_GLAL2|nr:uncharacterized protein GLAREA_01290 [Glarea lozoyensis ATCC 20868]EPE25378.1 hypothetical protein GLAREA_01290 [Glarea lozoyensis ATCC 20868]